MDKIYTIQKYLLLLEKHQGDISKITKREWEDAYNYYDQDQATILAHWAKQKKIYYEINEK